jgi:dihydropteroate synthase
MTLMIRDKFFAWGDRTYLMGIINVTPDSFSDGGEFNSVEAAVKQAEKAIVNGVDILDIGGQSTRPNAEKVAFEEELNRVIPVIEAIRKKTNIPISIDTTVAEVAAAAIEVGADIVNDISGATFDDNMLATVAKLDAPIVLMHSRGTPKTMQQFTKYQDLVGEIYQFLEQRIKAAISAGINSEKIIIDLGIGFAKTYQQNIDLLKNIAQFKSLDTPILIGTSRKSFIGQIINKTNPKERIWGTAATCCVAIANGTDILRVHDIAEMYDVCRTADVLWRG